MKLQEQLKIATLGLGLVVAACGGTPHTPHEVYLTVDGEALEMHIEVPEKNGTYPVAMFIHGGGWSDGNLHDPGLSHTRLKSFADRGYVAVSVDYRLTGPKNEDGSVRHPWPSQIQDVKCAVRWLKANHRRFKINPAAIGVSGISAGGHLALMLGETTNEDSAFESQLCLNNENSIVQAVSAWSPPADTVVMWSDDPNPSLQREWLIDLIGDTDPDTAGNQTFGLGPASALSAEAKAKLNYINPVTYVDANGPPTLIVHPNDDWIVVPQTSVSFFQALEAHGRNGYFFTNLTGGHTFNDGGLDKAYEATAFWFDRYLKNVEPTCSDWPACALNAL